MKHAVNIDFVGSYNCAYRKKIFAEFGGFDEKMIQAEDSELSFRVSKKYKILFQPDAFVYHRHATSLLSFARQKFQRAYWKIFLYKIHKKKTLRNVYTPTGLMPQTLLFGASITLLMLASFNIKFLYISIFLMLLSYVLNFRLLAYIKRKNSEMFLFAVALIFLRNLSASLGLVWGAKYLLKNAV
jgi:cellulose synthase/poly-beta-1,6-N-acetylglucosamine synthase-like glycosyltransferase